MQNINLIRKIAWSFHNTTGLEWDELFQEAALAYCEAMETYNPKKGKLSLYLWQRMYWRLQTYLQSQDAYKFKDWRSKITAIASLEDIKVDPEVESNYFWEALSEEAHEIAKVILASPKPYLEHNRVKAISRVKNVMKARGWDWRKVRRGLDDLKIAYSN